MHIQDKSPLDSELLENESEMVRVINVFESFIVEASVLLCC